MSACLSYAGADATRISLDNDEASGGKSPKVLYRRISRNAGSFSTRGAHSTTGTWKSGRRDGCQKSKGGRGGGSGIGLHRLLHMKGRRTSGFTWVHRKNVHGDHLTRGTRCKGLWHTILVPQRMTARCTYCTRVDPGCAIMPHPRPEEESPQPLEGSSKPHMSYHTIIMTAVPTFPEDDKQMSLTDECPMKH